MRKPPRDSHSPADRRSFLKKGLAAGAALGLLGDRPSALAQNVNGQGTRQNVIGQGTLTKGDAALLGSPPRLRSWKPTSPGRRAADGRDQKGLPGGGRLRAG
jgi:hypothetical protein